ncbi:MAG: hypothetical protein A2Z83_04180 [Omnitrophica bacterium GWA2_52_8]|nr:MAG: hypothetical protein A2Z83_04180 [Omnitrophica bacterium GWA2_52_8]
MGKTRACIVCGDLIDSGAQICRRCKGSSKDGIDNKRVLVITPDPLIVMAVKDHFVTKGTYVDGEPNLDKAAHYIKINSPDLVVFDLEGAATVALEFVTEINESGKKIHVIVISNVEGARRMFERIGIDAFFAKPMEKDEFLAQVEKSLLAQETV